MRYAIRQYAEALLGALEDKSGRVQSEVIRRFLSVIRKNKDWSKLGRILHEVEKQSLRKRGMRKVEVESAAPLSRELIKEIEKFLGKKLVLEEKVRPELLSGIKILVDNELLIDASAKRGLDSLFAER